jgi:hypothetical protein
MDTWQSQQWQLRSLLDEYSIQIPSDGIVYDEELRKRTIKRGNMAVRSQPAETELAEMLVPS